MVNPDKDSIERLKRKLSARVNGLPPVRHSPLDEHGAEIPHDWTHDHQPTKSWGFFESRMLQKILGIAIIFFVLMGAVTAWVFYRGDNVLSTNNVSIE